jgi:uncharacterized membrane protein (UPF0127 family)
MRFPGSRSRQPGSLAEKDYRERWPGAGERIEDNRMTVFRWIVSRARNLLTSRRNAPRDTRLQVSNLTRNSVLATCMEVADSAAKRNKGLLGRERLSPGEGLWIIPCEAVHTFWMRFSIDLVYLDRKKRIRKLVSEVRPWRLSACLWAHSVLELPPGTIRNTQTRPGDRLEFSISPMPETALESPLRAGKNGAEISQ